MRMKNLNNTAFSLLEILLAAVIFIISVGGIFITINAVRIPVANKENALAAAVFGKQVLETLRSQVNAKIYYNACSVNQTPCPDFSLSLGSHQVPVGNLPQGLTWSSQDLINANLVNGNPVLTYTVSCADGNFPNNCDADIARKVDLSINW
jgi:hypothetical protein